MAKGCGLVILIAVILMFVGIVAQHSKPSSTSPSTTVRSCFSGGLEVSGDDPGEKLAALEEETTCPQELTRARFRTLLARLGPKCRQPESRVGNMIFNTQHILKEKGVSVRLIEITEELDNSVQALGKITDDDACATVLALYAALRERQGVTGR